MLELTLTLVKFCQISIVAVMATVEIDLFLRNPIQLKLISYSLITHALGYNICPGLICRSSGFQDISNRV